MLLLCQLQGHLLPCQRLCLMGLAFHVYQLIVLDIDSWSEQITRDEL